MIKSIQDFGAKPNNSKVQTEIIQQAINELHSTGGGCLQIDGGSYTTGSIQLKTNVRLHIEHGSSLLGSSDITDYPDLPIHFHPKEKSYAWKALIWANNSSNIAITGNGTIDCQGGSDDFKVEREGFWSRVQNRPIGFYFYRCCNVLFKDIAMKDSAFWMHHHVECSRMHFSGIKLFNHCNFNNDGIDLDNCQDIIIDNCHIDACDDAICLKSMTAGSCKNIVVSNCILRSHYNAIKIGTETATSIKGLTVSNCRLGGSAHENKIMNTDSRAVSGISLISCDGADLAHITITNCHISNVMAPLFIRRQTRKRSLYEGMPAEHPAGVVRNIIITNLTAENVTLPSSICGIPDFPVENIILENWFIDTEGGCQEKESSLPQFEDGSFPDCTNSGNLIPALGFYLSHAKKITLRNITITPQQPDTRPLIYADQANTSFIIQNSIIYQD